MKSLTVRGVFWVLFGIDLMLLGVVHQYRRNLDRVEGFGTLLLQLALVVTAGCAVVFALTKPGWRQDRCLWVIAFLVLPIGVLKSERRLRGVRSVTAV